MAREVTKIEGSEKNSSETSLSLALANYNDLFSNFDPRPFTERSLSVDFLDEIRRASKDKPGEGLQLKLMVPRDKREVSQESAIKRRLKDHFRRHFNLLLGETKRIKRLGFSLAVLGVFFIVGAGFLYPYIDSGGFFVRLLFLLLEPACWFLGWTGLDQFFYTIRNKQPDFEFYKKMDSSEISFFSY